MVDLGLCRSYIGSFICNIYYDKKPSSNRYYFRIIGSIVNSRIRILAWIRFRYPYTTFCREQKTRFLRSRADTSCEKIKGKAILYLQKDSNSLSLKSGDKLIIYTTLSLPEKTGNPDEFDFGRHLLRNGICATGYASAERWKRISGADGFSLMRLAQRCRLKLLDISRKMNIDGNEFAIISALTLGYTDAISPELRDSFSVTGASHILSVSGLARGHYLRDARSYARLPRQMETHAENQMDSRDIVPLVLCFRNRTLALGISVGIYVFALCCG